jgi:hypothetical protein
MPQLLQCEKQCDFGRVAYHQNKIGTDRDAQARGLECIKVLFFCFFLLLKVTYRMMYAGAPDERFGSLHSNDAGGVKASSGVDSSTVLWQGLFAALGVIPAIMLLLRYGV